MEETFAQIEGASQHSLADVNVNITAGGSIVGQGVTASSNAINVCGGKLDAILRSFGGIQGGDESIGGKSMSLLEKVGALGIKAGGQAQGKIQKLLNCVEKMRKVADAAGAAGLEDVAKHYRESAAELEALVTKHSDNLDKHLSEFSARQDKFIDATSQLSQSTGNASAAGILSLAFSGVNNTSALATKVKAMVASLDGHSDQAVEQAVQHLANPNDKAFVAALNELLQCLGHDGRYGGVEGGLEGGLDVNANKLVDRLASARNEVKKIINAFIDEFGKNINGISDSAEAMAAQFGKSIDYDEKTIAFLDHFSKIAAYLSDSKRQSKIYQHLLELNVDQVDSKEIKDRFLSQLRVLAESADVVDSTASSKSFAKHCRDIIATVGHFGDKIKSHRDAIKSPVGGSTDTMNELFSVDASKIDISGLLAPLERLNIVIKKLKFFRNIAIFRSNLQQTSKELSTYTKDYNKSVGKAIGDAISKIKAEYKDIIAQVGDNKSGMGLEIDMYNESQPTDKKISKEKLKQMYQWQCDARVGLYKTVEAIDLYLLHFTEAISKNPDAVADLHKMLTATKIIAKWYDAKAGDNLIRMFESFADGVDVEAGDFITKYDTKAAGFTMADLQFKLTGDKAVKAYERARRAVEGVVVLKNIISYFITIGEKYGDMKSDKHILMAPSNIYKNLVNYIWVSSIDLNTTGTEILDDNNQLKRVLTYEDTKASIAMINNSVDPETFGINFNKHSIDKLRILKCHQEVVRLKDSVSSDEFEEDVRRIRQCVTGIFARLGKTEYIFEMLKFGVYDLSQMDKQMITQFVTKLQEFLEVPLDSGAARGDGANRIKFTVPGFGEFEILKGGILTPDQMNAILNTPRRNDIKITLEGSRTFPLMSLSEFQDSRTLLSTILPSLEAGENDTGFLRGFLKGLMGEKNRRAFPRAFRLVAVLQYVIAQMMAQFKRENQNSVFAIDDTYFVLTIKAIAGKIMAVTGVNRLLKDPNSYKNVISKNHARLIMGGAEGDVDVIDHAVELYIRLPLLVEFYRMIFDDGNKDYVSDSVTEPLDEERISFVPEVGNIWSGLIMNIFEKSKHIHAGVYTVQNMTKIVSEVNAIYKHYKGSVPDDELVRHVMTQLVAEINRRYGVIKRQELLQYYRVVNATKRANFGSEVVESNYSTNDFDILNEELEFEKNSPSDEFIKLKETMKDASTPMETKINRLTDYKIMKEFRERIDTALSTGLDDLRVDGTPASDFITIVDRVRLLKKSIASKTSRTEKYEMIIKAIEESTNINQFSNDIFTCFHEFVIMPLRTAYQMHNALEVFMATVFRVINTAGVRGELLESKVGDAGATLREGIALYAAAKRDITSMAGGRLIVSEGSDLDVVSIALLKTLTKFSNNSANLVKLSISTTNRISIDFSEYQRVCEHLIANVKFMVDKFQGLVPASLINKVTNPTEEGSVYWLEKAMVSGTFNKIEKSERTREVACIDNITKLMPVISSLIYTRDVPLPNLIENLIMYRPMIIGKSETKDCLPIIRDAFMTYNRDSRMFTTPARAGPATEVSYLLFDPSSTSSLVSSNKHGIIQEFNNLVAHYLNDLYDAQGRKMYTKAYSNFASSALIDALNGQSLPDFGTNVGNWYTLSNSSVILSACLAYVMKVLANRSNPATNMKIHEVGSLQDVSANILEKYRMHIPMYIRLFKLFVEKCKVYRRVIAKMNVTPADMPFRAASPNTNVREFEAEADVPFVTGYNRLDTTSESAVSIVLLQIDQIINSMNSLIQDAEGVQQELLETDNTVSLYFDVKKDFTKNYMSSNNEAPFAPLSILAMGFANVDPLRSMSPIRYTGSTGNKKFLYGMRSLFLNNFELSSSKIPFVKKLLADFNGYTNSSNNITEKKFDEVITHVGRAVNYIYDLRFFSGSADMLQSVVPVAATVLTYQERKPTIQGLTLIENINIVDSSNQVAEHVKQYGGIRAPDAIVDVGATNPRKKVIMINIIDVNIMPINVHSLMREIPLANLYNYAMTFDSIVNDLSGMDSIREFLKSPYMKLGVNSSGDILVPKTRSAWSLDKFEKIRFMGDVLMDRVIKHSLPTHRNAAVRLNTKIFRNLAFLSMIQLAIKKKVKSELEFINTRVVSNNAAVGTAITALTDDDGNTVNENLFEF